MFCQTKRKYLRGIYMRLCFLKIFGMLIFALIGRTLLWFNIHEFVMSKIYILMNENIFIKKNASVYNTIIIFCDINYFPLNKRCVITKVFLLHTDFITKYINFIINFITSSQEKLRTHNRDNCDVCNANLWRKHMRN